MSWIPYVNIILGLWLMVSPFIFGYAYNTAAFWNTEVVGVVLFITTGVIALAHPTRGVAE
jgi:hypothetical protein